MKIRKKVTPAKRAANKKSAKESTGPKSVLGKSRASRNAITHGSFARDMLLPGESEREWKQLRSEMIDSYGAVGSRERRRVEKLTWSEWRLRRVRRGEAGELGKLLAEHETRAEIAASSHTPQFSQAVADLTHLEEIENQINSEGRVSAENLGWLREFPYGDEAKNFLDLIEITEPAEAGEVARPTPEMPAAVQSEQPTRTTRTPASSTKWDFARPLLLGILDSLKETSRGEQLHHGEYLMRRAEAQRNALLLPQEAVLNRIIRCETHILRNMERDENALERMQRLRGGDKVPPPSARVD